jgi:PAS domain S-box-containing protein
MAPQPAKAAGTDESATTLRQMLQLQASLIEMAHDAILIRDPASIIVSWNRGAEDLYGWTAQEAIGQVTHDLLKTQFPESFEAIELVLAAGEQWQGELVHTRRDGRQVIVESRQVLVSDGQGQPSAILEINRDITERKQRERENQEQYRTIVRTANEGIWLISVKAETLYMNERMAEMLGYSVEEMMGHTVPEFVFAEDQTEARERIGSNLQGNFEQFDFRFRRKDGTALEVLACTSPVRDGRGVITGAMGMFTDLTSRKRVEEQAQFLAEVSKILSSTLDYSETLANIARLVVPQLADWFSVDLLNEQGKFELIELSHKDPQKVEWARTLRERFPIDYDAPTGLPHVVRTGQSELLAEIPEEVIMQAVKNEEELAIVREIGFSSVMNVPLVARGKTIGVVSFVSAESGKHYDQQDLELAEEIGRRAGVALDNARLYREMTQARDQLEIILQGAADGIIVYEKNGWISYANDAAAQLTGYPSASSLLGTSLDNLLTRYTIVDEQGQPFFPSLFPFQRVLAGEREAQATIGYTNVRTGKPDRWVSIKSRPVLDEHGEISFVVTIMHDLTERMLAEMRKDEFISMTSHELKTPVTSLKGFTNVLHRRLIKQGDEQGLHYLSRIDMQLNKLTKLISDLLDMSRMQSGKLDFQIEPFDLDTFISETVENVQAAALTHRILVEGRADTQIEGDKDRLGQVLINLLTNAIKYSPRADKVIVRVVRDAGQAIISVQDFGIGIAGVHHQKIFERFYQVTDPEEKTYPGLGIGLHISQEIVRRHSGRIWVESTKGEGATFFVSLPLPRKE